MRLNINEGKPATLYYYKDFIKLEDLTKNYKHPSILDLKMGFNPPSDKLKKKYENTTSKTLGFRICGMNVLNLFLSE
jgi:hypothetical protein